MLKRFLSFIIALCVVILIPVSASAEISTEYDKFRNGFIIRSIYHVRIDDSQTQFLSVVFDKKYILSDTPYHKNPRLLMDFCTITFLTLGEEYFFFNDTAYYAAPNSRGESFDLEHITYSKSKEDITSVAWSLVNRYDPLYKDILNNKELDFQLTFRNQASFTFTIPPEIIQEWHKIITFSYIRDGKQLLLEQQNNK